MKGSAPMPPLRTASGESGGECSHCAATKELVHPRSDVVKEYGVCSAEGAYGCGGQEAANAAAHESDASDANTVGLASRCQHAVYPPSRLRTCPVKKRDASLRK